MCELKLNLTCVINNKRTKETCNVPRVKLSKTIYAKTQLLNQLETTCNQAKIQLREKYYCQKKGNVWMANFIATTCRLLLFDLMEVKN